MRPGDVLEVVAPPISVSLIEQRRMTMATRRTHKTVRPSAESIGAAGNPLSLMMQQLMSFHANIQQPAYRVAKSNAAAPMALTYSATGQPVVQSPVSTSSISAGSSMEDLVLQDEANPQVEAARTPKTLIVLSPIGAPPGTPKTAITESPTGTPPLPPPAIDKKKAVSDLSFLTGELEGTLTTKSEVKAEEAAKLAASEGRRFRMRSKGPAAFLHRKSAIVAPKKKGKGKGRGKKSKGKRRGKGKGKGKAAKAAAMPPRPADAAAAAAAPALAMPSLAEGRNRLSFLGCRILVVPDKLCFRVLPMPGVSRYDKLFTWNATRTPEDTWKSVIAYCRAPVLPAKRTGEF